MNPPPNRRGAWYRYVDAAPMICVSSGRPLNSCWYMNRSGPLYELTRFTKEQMADIVEVEPPSWADDFLDACEADGERKAKLNGYGYSSHYGFGGGWRLPQGGIVYKELYGVFTHDQCPSCRRWIESDDTSFGDEGVCFYCSFWLGHAAESDSFVVIRSDGEWHHYIDGGMGRLTGNSRGHGGARWTLVKGDQEVESDNWWHQGTVPTEHRHLFINDLWEVKQ